ncbi:MAG TPA: hypothetical protein VF786_13420 [Terriglobales bacterium]
MKKRILRIGVLVLLCLLLVVYAADTLSVRWHIPRSRQLYSQVTVENYDAVKLKSGKTEYYFDQPQVETCVNSLFPHQDLHPCWYTRRHALNRNDIDASPPQILR